MEPATLGMDVAVFNIGLRDTCEWDRDFFHRLVRFYACRYKAVPCQSGCELCHSWSRYEIYQR